MTDNHEYILQEKGDTDWHIPLNDTIRELDREVPIRDKESNLTDYEPKAEATFIATDTGAVYSADGATWYLEDLVVSDFEAKNSITFPDGSTVTSPGSGSAVDFEEDGSTVVSNAGAANFVEAGAATVNVTDDGDGSVTVEVSATDTNTERTNEEIEDIVAALVSGGTNITTTYDDGNDTYTIDGLSDEQIEDIVGAMAGNNLSYDDTNALLNATDTTLTDEDVQDIVGLFVTGGSNATVTYDDAGNTLTVSATDTTLTDEEVEDIIGAAVNAGLSYDDANNQINLTSTDVTVAGNTVSLGGTTGIAHADLSSITSDDHHARYTDEESQDAVGTILGSNFTYSDATPSINLASDTVTVAGNAVPLGGSTGVAHSDLTGIGSGDHHTRYTDEEAQDAVGTIFGSTLQYSDSAPSMNVADNSIGLTQLANPFELYNLAAVGGAVDIGSNDLVADTSAIWNESNNSVTADINTGFANANRLFFPDTAQNPSVNGQIRRNGNDILAYSGGSIRNLSNIGSGSSGAPSDASYLTTASESGLSNETVVSSYPFSLNADTDLNVGGNDLTDGTTASVIWDASQSEVPQSQLGGPASGLTSYPIPGGDLETESFQDKVGDMAGQSVTYDDVNGSLDVNAAGFKQVSASGNYTASPSDSVWADASSSSVTVTLPSPNKSDEVRVTAVSTNNPVTVSESGTEGIQTPNGTVSTYTLAEDETIHVEANGSTWRVVGALSAQLDSGTLGTLSTSVDFDDFRISNVAQDETQEIASVSAFPQSAINEDYAFNSVDWYREWDESAGELDIVVTVNWDTKPSVDITLDYIVWGSASGTGGAGGSGGDEAFKPTGPITSSTYTGSWDEVVAANTASNNITITLPSPGSDGQFTVYKDDSANTLTVETPGNQTIKGKPTPWDITKADTSYTFAVFPGDSDYRVI